MRPNLKRRQEIIGLRNQGMTRQEMADQLGISKNLIGGYLHQLIHEGIIEPYSKKESSKRNRRNRRVRANVDVAEAKKMRDAGKSYNEIAEYYGVSGPTIEKLIGSTVRITPIQRQIIDLRSQHLTYGEIAAHLGKPEGTVAVMISRLIKKGLVKIPSTKTGPTSSGS